MIHTDILGNDIHIGDYVISYNHLYIVLDGDKSYTRIILASKSKTTRALSRWCKELVVVSSLVKETDVSST
jgi:hypothetical protein